MILKYKREIPKISDLDLVLLDEKVNLMFIDKKNKVKINKDPHQIFNLKQLGEIGMLINEEMKKRKMFIESVNYQIDFSDFI